MIKPVFSLVFFVYIASKGKVKNVSGKTLDGAIIHHWLVNNVQELKVLFFLFSVALS